MTVATKRRIRHASVANRLARASGAPEAESEDIRMRMAAGAPTAQLKSREDVKPAKRPAPLGIKILNFTYFVSIAVCMFFAIFFFFEYKNAASGPREDTLGETFNLIKAIGCLILGVALAVSKVCMMELYS